MIDHANKLTEELTAVMKPKAAIVAYQHEGYRTSSYYLELRRINDKGVMGAGMPVPLTFLKTISENYVDSTGGMPHGALPETMLFCDTRRGSEKYVWYDPPCKRMMYFTQSLGMENTEYHIPGVVYVAKENSLHIYAYKDKKPTAKTELFCGPFFNTTNGSVCLGSATIKKPLNPSFGEFIRYWEKRFWLTEFTHLGGGSNPTRNNLVLVTKNAIKKDFDLDELKSAGIKIKDLFL